MPDYDLFSLGYFPLECGQILPDATLAYKLYGELNAQKSNAILIPSWYSGNHTGYEFLIQPGRCLDPTRYCIITVNMFANGLSSSPSTTPAPLNGPHFPAVSIRDNVAAQYRLVHDLGIERLALVAGFSMGAQQTFQWAVSHPDRVERIVALCGAARTTPHTHVFIEGFTSALKADAAWNGGEYENAPDRGLRAMARVYAGWGFSQAWYRQELNTQLGHPSVEDFLVRFWETFFLQCDANDLLSQAKTWQAHNVGDTPGFGGDHKRALAAITARAIIMPGQTDLYFPPEDSAAEVACMPNAILKTVPSIWGHFCGAGINPVDTDFIDRAIKDCLAEQGADDSDSGRHPGFGGQ